MVRLLATDQLHSSIVHQHRSVSVQGGNSKKWQKIERRLAKPDDDDADEDCSYPTPACSVGGPGSGFCSMLIPLGPVGPIGIPPIEPPICIVPFFGMMCPCWLCPFRVPW